MDERIQYVLNNTTGIIRRTLEIQDAIVDGGPLADCYTSLNAIVLMVQEVKELLDKM